ncbi:MAG: P-II family nitrogen regulator [Nitrososphaeraceae archaeon]
MTGYNLPFEIVESEQDTGKKIKAGLKRLEIFATQAQVDAVVTELRKAGLEATVYDARGYGKDQQMIKAGKSGGQTVLTYSTRRTIVTILDSNKLEEVMSILNHMNDGHEKKVGVIAIQSVDALIHL